MNNNAVVRPLISLATNRAVNTPKLFVETSERLTGEELAQHYRAEMENAPDRASVGKSYLIDTHHGIPSTGTRTSRNEEHFALAIFNQHRPPSAGLQLPDGEELHILEYQLPLKARRSDLSVGKADLFGITGSGQAAVIELKAARGGDTPLRALLEGLAYTAIVQANLATLRKEVQQRYSRTITADTPRLIVMAPDDYWSRFRSRRGTKGWENQLQTLADRILLEIGVAVDFVALRNWSFAHGFERTRPVLDGSLACLSALAEAQL